MPVRKVVYGVQVFRDGKLIAVKPGTKFNFTADEIKDIKKAKANAIIAVDVEDEAVVETDEQRAARLQAEKDESARIQAANDKAVADKEAADKAEADAKAKEEADAKAAKKGGKAATRADDL